MSEEELIHVCCQCECVKDHKDNWNKSLRIKADHYKDDGSITHTYCPTCLDVVMAEAKAYNREVKQ